MNEKQKRCVEDLKEDFERYQYVLENGSNDPSWSDGVNLNLIRNHIIHHKKIIEKEFVNESYPDIYFQPTPDEMDSDFMVHEDMIRQKANQTLKRLNSFFYLDELKNASYYLEPKQLVEAGIQQSVNRIHVLEQAIDEDDLVTMRRISSHENEYYEDLEKAFENLREINLEEERQISFFEIMM